MTVRRGRRRRQLLDDIEKKGYHIFKDEALYGPLRKTSTGKVYGPVIRQTKE